ncbi:MAG: phospholipase D family protein [Candidatus Methylopumilus sp.]|jgi:hypothetical protein
MQSQLVGERLLELCRNTKQDVFIAAPFIKVFSLSKILEVIPVTSKVKVVTRWKPEEIAAGVSDLEIFALLQSRSIELFLHPALHAKLYRVDEKCLIGSANITESALGWSWQPNIELMVDALASDQNIQYIESRLIAGGIKVSQPIHDAMKAQVEQLLAANNEFKAFKSEHTEMKWLPLCVKPDLLFKIYSNADTSSMLKSTVDCGSKDLLSLKLPAGMLENDFNKYISAYLDGHPVKIQIDQLSATKVISSVEGANLLRIYSEPDFKLPYNINDHWNIVKSWLTHFYKNKYNRAPIDEGFSMGKVI